MKDLGTLGGSSSVGFDINNSGDIVGGSSVTDEREYYAFLYSNGVMSDLGSLGGSLSEAGGINDRGQVVGYSVRASGESRAFLYSDGVMNDLGTLGLASTAVDINDGGQIV